MAAETSGLHYDPAGDDAFDRLRQQARSLSRNLSVDVDRARTFGAASGAEAAAISGESVVDGLVSVDDPAALAERMRAMRDREADLKVQRLLDRAERAADQGDHGAALTLVNEALGLDRTSASAWLLKGRCLIEIGDFAQAAQVIAVAQRHARDPSGVRLAAALLRSCEREEMRAFTATLSDLVEQDRLAEATDRVRQRLRERPEDPILLHNWCALLLLADDVQAARAVAEDALRTVDRSEGGRFEELLRHIAQRECEPRIEAARTALRRGDTAGALARLEECAGAIGDTERFLALRSYAQQRHADRAQLALVRRLRRRADERSGAAPVDPDTRQRLIEWLVQEELDAGWAAFQNEDYPAASRQFEAAEAIDDRCCLISFLHAAALFRGLLDQFEGRRKPSLEHAHEVLAEAVELAGRAAGDASVGQPSRELAATLRSSLDTVREVQRQVARAEAVNGCVSRFNQLVKHYERYPIRTVEQRDAAARSFQSIARQATGLAREPGGDPREAQVLHDLVAAVGDIRRQLYGRR